MKKCLFVIIFGWISGCSKKSAGEAHKLLQVFLEKFRLDRNHYCWRVKQD